MNLKPQPNQNPQKSRPLTQVGIEDLISWPPRVREPPRPHAAVGPRLRKPSPASKSGPKPKRIDKNNQPLDENVKKSFTGSQSIVLSPGHLYKRYEKSYSLQVGVRHLSVLSVRNPSNSDKHHGGLAEEFTGNGVTQQVRNIQKIRHPRFLEALDTYKIDEGFLVIFEFMPFSLLELSTVQKLKDSHLATIFSQVRNKSDFEREWADE
jgi:hypothetical protein